MTHSPRFPMAHRVIGTGIPGVACDIDDAMLTAQRAIHAYETSNAEETYDDLIGARMQVRRLTFSADVISVLEGVPVTVPEALSSWAGLDQSRTPGDAVAWCDWRLESFAGVSYRQWQVALAARDGRSRLTGLMALIDELPDELLDLKQFEGEPQDLEKLRLAMRQEAVMLVASEQPLVHILELWDAAVNALTEDCAVAGVILQSFVP